MIITVEADGQACLDTGSVKKPSLEITILQQPSKCSLLDRVTDLLAERGVPQCSHADHLADSSTHPALRNVDTGYAESISTAAGSLAISEPILVEEDIIIETTGKPVVKDRRCRIFRSPFKQKEQHHDPLMSASMVGDEEKSPRPLPGFWSSWRTLNKRCVASSCYVVEINLSA